MTAAIVLNGTAFSRAIMEEYVICADGGARLVAREKINVIVGDMDSISDHSFDVECVKVPIEKDFSDGELAIKIAKDRGYATVSIYGANGGRIDHAITNYMLLVFARSLGMDCVIKNDDCDVYYIEGNREFAVEKGATISFLPFLCDRAIVTVNNVKYPLDRLALTSSNPSRGLSNITLTDTISVNVEEGGVLFFYNF